MTNESPTTRRLLIRHKTAYRYSAPIARSIHRLRLRPLVDPLQRVLRHDLTIQPSVATIQYEDVFGNMTSWFELNQPYSDMTITAESEVELLDTDPFAFARTPIRPSFPLAWMPWEQKMLSPYLTPQELPDTHLHSLYDYAMSFVEKNNRDLMETLFAINLELFRAYKYAPGTTNAATTAFDVLCNRSGVCQDFANLFICMARLLAIPARYVWGYIYTGNCGEHRAGSDATHAWVQLYIPNVGWKGFDPTNGILPATDHVRVGYGRNYRDAAPVSGTLFSPASETMQVDVEVRDLQTPGTPAPALNTANTAAA